MEYIKKFEKIVSQQLSRIEKMKETKDFIDYQSLDKIVIGVIGGDGIGPTITAQARRVLEYLLDDEVKKGKVEFRTIEGCTMKSVQQQEKLYPMGS